MQRFKFTKEWTKKINTMSLADLWNFYDYTVTPEVRRTFGDTEICKARDYIRERLFKLKSEGGDYK